MNWERSIAVARDGYNGAGENQLRADMLASLNAPATF